MQLNRMWLLVEKKKKKESSNAKDREALMVQEERLHFMQSLDDLKSFNKTDALILQRFLLL